MTDHNWQAVRSGLRHARRCSNAERSSHGSVTSITRTRSCRPTSSARRRRARACLPAPRAAVVYHTYSTTWREIEFLMGYCPILDRAPKGRDEGERRSRSGSAATTSATKPQAQDLWRRHDGRVGGCKSWFRPTGARQHRGRHHDRPALSRRKGGRGVRGRYRSDSACRRR